MMMIRPRGRRGTVVSSWLSFVVVVDVGRIISQSLASGCSW